MVDFHFLSEARESFCRMKMKLFMAMLPAMSALGSPLAHADGDAPIYLHKALNGNRVYTDSVPRRATSYIQINTTISGLGRPVAKAATSVAAPTSASVSCMGLTAAKIETRASSFQALIDKYATEHGVKPALIRAVMRVESCFDQYAVSRAGARGLMQLMPQTAAHLGVRDSFDANENVNGGVRYLKMMLERFDQNTKLALAAYNAGPGAVMNHKGIPPFPETRSYVRRVFADYQKNVSRELIDVGKTPSPA